MVIRHKCLLYHDVLLFCDMLRKVNLTNMLNILKLSLYDLLGKITMLLVVGMTSMLTIEKPRKKSLERSQSKDSFCAELCEKVKFYSNKPIKRKESSYAVLSDVTKTDLVLLYTWLNANEKATQKYIEFYLSMGFDVLKVHTTILDAIQPETGAQIYANHVLKFLNQNNQYSSIVVHGMSIGGYAFGESVVKMQDNPAAYGDIPKRFVGLVFDSGVDYRYTADGLAKTIVNNRYLQKFIVGCFNWFLKVNYKHSTRHYERSSKSIHLDYLDVPVLFINSKADLLCSPIFLELFAAGISKKKYKCFDESPHIQHYRYYPTEYEKEIKAFLKDITYNEKIHSGI